MLNKPRHWNQTSTVAEENTANTGMCLVGLEEHFHLFERVCNKNLFEQKSPDCCGHRVKLIGHVTLFQNAALKLWERKEKPKMSHRYNRGLCQTAGWYIANKMVNVWAMKRNLCLWLRARPNLLSCSAGFVCVWGEERKAKGSGGINKKHFQCFKKYLSVNLIAFSLHQMPSFNLFWGLACSMSFYCYADNP